MNTTDLFIKAVKSLLENGVTQVSLAKELGVQPQQLNSFLKGRRNFSEDRKEQISKILGKSYLEMLLLGHRLETDQDLTTPDIPINISGKAVAEKIQALNQDDLKLVDDLVNRLSKK